MASGKTTVGRQCARALAYRFRDSDSLVERRARKPVSAIFAEEGEAVFRAMEAAAIRDLARGSRAVISTGGGAVMNPANVAYLRRTGVVVLLWTAPEEIVARVGDCQTRPLLANADNPCARVEQLLNQREPTYRAAAHTVIETTGRTRDEVVEQVLEAYRSLSIRQSRSGNLR